MATRRAKRRSSQATPLSRGAVALGEVVTKAGGAAAVAARLMVTSEAVYQWLNGRRNPSKASIKAIYAEYKLPLAWWFEPSKAAA